LTRTTLVVSPTKTMKVHIKKVYHKKTRIGRPPASFHAKQPKWVGTTVHAVVKLDPILKKHKDLHRGIMKHEKHEIKAWGQGLPMPHAHARTKEPKLTRNIGGVSGFWKEIDRRKNRRRVAR